VKIPNLLRLTQLAIQKLPSMRTTKRPLKTWQKKVL
jgi:hypothetical protein